MGVENGQFWKRHLDHLKDYAPKHLPEAHHTEPESEIDVDNSLSAESGSARSVLVVTPTVSGAVSTTATTAEDISATVPPIAQIQCIPSEMADLRIGLPELTFTLVREKCSKL